MITQLMALVLLFFKSISYPRFRLNTQFKMIASPIKLSDTPVEYRQAPPQLGEHTAYILSRFKSAEELQALKQQGIIDGKIA